MLRNLRFAFLRSYRQHCRVKPKYGEHDYCGKRCAGAAKLCIVSQLVGLQTRVLTSLWQNCKKKPKNPGHEYCSRHCAQSHSSNETRGNARPSHPRPTSQYPNSHSSWYRNPLSSSIQAGMTYSLALLHTSPSHSTGNLVVSNKGNHRNAAPTVITVPTPVGHWTGPAHYEQHARERKNLFTTFDYHPRNSSQQLLSNCRSSLNTNRS